MPPLYGIACVAFIILYINERLLVCYYYREPPAFDEKMTQLTLDLTKWVPFIMLPMAFWQLGNRQIFETVISEIDFKADIQESGHDFGNALSHMDPTFMTYNTGPLWLLILIILYSWIQKLRGVTEEEEEDDGLVEGLDDYYDALKKPDKAAYIGHEEYFSKYGCKTMSAEQLSKMKQAKATQDAIPEKDLDLDKLIQGVATYRLLDNLQYQQDLQYEPARVKDDGSIGRDDVVIISTDEAQLEEGQEPKHDVQQMDATYLCVNLAFLTERQQIAFKMDTTNG